MRRHAPAAVLLCTAALGCSSGSEAAGRDAGPACPSPPDAPLPDGSICPAGWYRYRDTFCSPEMGMCTDGGTLICSTTGDGRCYRRCTSDADCTDPCFSKCVELDLFNDGDCCPCGFDTVRVCGNARAPVPCTDSCSGPDCAYWCE